MASLIDAEVDHKKAFALSGLHCCSNLQVLSFEDHKIKTAADMRLIADMKRKKAKKK